MDRDIGLVLGGSRRELVEDLPWNEYRDLVAMNPSTIAYGRKSLLELKHHWDNPSSDTDSLLWGRAVHCLLFEPREFESRYKVWEGRRAGKDYTDFVSECREFGVEVMPSALYDSAVAAGEAFVRLVQKVREMQAKPPAPISPIEKMFLDAYGPLPQLIASGKSEVTLFEVEGRIQCRGRVDWVSLSAHHLVDLKTTRDISVRAFSKDFYRFGYDLKMGLYQRWLNRLTGEHWPVTVVVMENKKPYDIAVMPIHDSVLDLGARKGLAILDQLEMCIDADLWPGVGIADYCLNTPVWEMDDAELEGAEEV